MFTEFDVVVTIILVAFTLVAVMRGFVKDLLSFIAWFGSTALTLYFYPYTASIVDNFLKNTTIVSVISVLTTYMILLIAFSIFNVGVLKIFGESRKGPIDRSFGLVFGLFKGVFIVSIIHYCIFLVSKGEPDWLKEGQTYKITNYGHELIEEYAGDFIKGMIEDSKKRAEDAEDAVDDVVEKLEDKKELLQEFGEGIFEEAK